MYRHLLIPTDGSALSGHAIAQGMALAKATGARVTGLFVAPAPTPLVFEGLVPVDYLQPDEHAELNARAAARYLGAIEKAAQEAGVPFEGVSLTGEYPAEAILETAKQRRCDVIVMASHGRRGLAGVLLGSETLKVLTHAKVPVLVCRQAHRAAASDHFALSTGMLERSIALWASCPSKAPVWVRKPRLLDAMMSRIAFGPRAGHEGVRTSAAGEVVRKLKTAWGNGPTLLVMSPLKFMRPSAALGPRT